MIEYLGAGFLAVDLAVIVAGRGSADAMNDTTTQLAILSDALVKIIDLDPLAAEGQVAPANLLIRAGDIAAQALTAAATYGQCRPSLGPSMSNRIRILRAKIADGKGCPTALVRPPEDFIVPLPIW